MPRTRLSSSRTALARRLRREQTDPERLLWGRLRDHRLNELGFRRQAPMGRYVADFVCHRARLVVELDGGQHGEDGHRAGDRRRDAWFTQEGYLVLRFWNHEVMTNLESVVETIHAHASARTPSPAAAPAGVPS